MDDGVTGDVFQRILPRNLPCSAPDNDPQLGLIIHLFAHGRDNNGFMGSDNRVGIHAKQERLPGRLSFDLFNMIFVIEPNSDKFLWMGNWRTEGSVRFGKEIALYTTGRALQMAKLVFEQRETFFDL